MIDNIIKIWYDPTMDEFVLELNKKTYCRRYADYGGIEDELTGSSYYEIFSILPEISNMIYDYPIKWIYLGKL